MRKLTLLLVIIFLLVPKAYGAENYVISDPQVYTVIHTETINNPTNKVSKDVTVRMTLLDTNQPPYQTFLGEELDPKPEEIYRNSNGTRFGIWKIKQLQPGEKIVFTQKYAVRNYAIEFQLDSNAGLGKYYNVPMRYLLPEPRIEVDDPQITAYAHEIAGGNTNPYEIAKLLFADISTRLNYMPGPNANKGAINALNTGQGVCDDYTALFVAAARSLGIPARWTAGYLYQPMESTSNRYLPDGSIDLSNLRHAWPEFMLPYVGWVVLDPTYASNVNGNKEVDFSKFAKISSKERHIFTGYENSRIDYEYFGAEPKIQFSERMELGKHIIVFPDIQKHWAKDNILFLSDYHTKIIGGFPDGNFYPNEKITRAQVAAMLNRALGLDYNINAKNFVDVSTGHWAYSDILAMKYNGIVGGYSNGTYQPNNNITRAELAVILARAFDFIGGENTKSFNDIDAPKYFWSRNSIMLLAQNGIIGGYSDGTFRPNNEVTRAEFATFLARILDYNKRLK